MKKATFLFLAVCACCAALGQNKPDTAKTAVKKDSVVVTSYVTVQNERDYAGFRQTIALCREAITYDDNLSAPQKIANQVLLDRYVKQFEANTRQVKSKMPVTAKPPAKK